MVRLSAVAAPVLLAAAAALTPRNSVVAPLVSGDRVVIEGVGCGVPASAAFGLPSGAAGVRVARPAPGARSLDARLTGVSILGDDVVLTAAADSAAICDPAEQDTPPAARPWSASFDAEAAYRLRVGVVFRDDDRVRGAAFKVRPREVRIGLAGAARGVRWTRFGGRTAVGFGRFRSLVPCAGGCSDDGTRLRVRLSRPGYCPGETLPGHPEPAVFYTRVAFILEQRLGVLKRGREWMSAVRRSCGTAPRPTLIR
jgi:hypothetical protein